jgi:hypothetical protein
VQKRWVNPGRQRCFPVSPVAAPGVMAPGVPPFYGDFNPQRLRPDRYRLKNSAGKETRHGCTGNPVIGIEYDPDLVRRPME